MWLVPRDTTYCNNQPFEKRLNQNPVRIPIHTYLLYVCIENLEHFLRHFLQPFRKRLDQNQLLNPVRIPIHTYVLYVCIENLDHFLRHFFVKSVFL